MALKTLTTFFGAAATAIVSAIPLAYAESSDTDLENEGAEEEVHYIITSTSNHRADVRAGNPVIEVDEDAEFIIDLSALREDVRTNCPNNSPQSVAWNLNVRMDNNNAPCAVRSSGSRIR